MGCPALKGRGIIGGLADWMAVVVIVDMIGDRERLSGRVYDVEVVDAETKRDAVRPSSCTAPTDSKHWGGRKKVH